MRNCCFIYLSSLILGTMGSLQGVSADVVYDASTGFSTTANPNGVWTYGSSTTLGSTFIQGVTHGKSFGIDYWVNDFNVSSPSITHNGTSGAIQYANITWQPGQLGFHPGSSGQNAVIRFTAPSAESYSLSSAFKGLDRTPTTTDVHVLLNGVSLFNGVVNGFGSGPTFSNILSLSVGDKIDFSVGYGSNGTNLFDTTGLTATLTVVPEPSGSLAFALGSLMVASYYGRRRVF